MSIRKPNYEQIRSGLNNRIERDLPAPLSLARSRRVSPLRFAGLLAAFSLLVGVLLATPRTVDAATIATGANSIDTVYKTDGTAGYVLGSGTSTISVIDPDTYAITASIPLGIAPGIAQDLDWSNVYQRLVVGCNNGIILSVDPATSAVVTLINNPAANYSQICADHYVAGTFGWGYDTTTGFLHQFFPGGTWAPIAPLPVGTPTELVEKQYDPLLPTVTDGFLLMLGTATGMVTVDAFNRATMTSFPLVSWLTAPATSAGITTDGSNPDAYIVANGPGPGPGYLIQLNLFTMAYVAAPIKTYVGVPVTDVTMLDQWIAVAHPGLGGGTVINIFDAGDSANVKDAGDLLVDPTLAPGGGISGRLKDGGTIDDLDILIGLGGTGTYGGGDLTGDPLFNDGTPATVVSGVLPAGTVGNGIYPGQPPLICGSCDDALGKEHGSINFAYPSADIETDRRVNYGTGEEVCTLPVFSVPGVGIDLDFALTYRSRIDYQYRYGNGWSLNQDSRIRVEGNGDRTYFNGTGRRDVYVSAGGSWIPPYLYDTTLAVPGSSSTITDRFGQVSIYNATGQRTSVADRYGNTITYAWTGDQLTSITDTLGRAYTLSYTAQGRLSSVADFGGRTWTFAYDYLGQLKTMTTPATTQFPSGRIKRFSYSGNSAQPRFVSNLTHVWSEKGDKVQTLTYDNFDFVTKEVIGPGTYDISYDGVTLITTVVDRSGNTRHLTFDPQGMLTKAEKMTKGLRVGEPASFTTNYSIGLNGLVQNAVYPRGNRRDWTWDGKFNLTELRVKTTNTSSTSASDIVYGYVYEATYSQLIQSTDPRGNVTTYTVDASGDTTQIARPTVTSPASQSITESFTYDSSGRVLTATDGAGRSASFVYHASGPQTGYIKDVKRDPVGLNLVTSFTYDQFGNVLTVTDPRGNVTTMAVDAENFVTQVTAPSPFAYRRKVTYDANRDVTLVETENIDRKGVIDPTTPWIETSLTYNPLGWLTSKESDLTASSTATTNYEYQGAGLLTKVTTAVGNVTQIQYDERDLLFKATGGFGTGDATTTQYDYDINGNLDTFTDGRGNATAFTYDLFDRRTKTTNALGHYAERVYDKSSNVTTITAKEVGGVVQAKTTNYFDELDRNWKIMRDRFASGLTTTHPTTTITRDKGHLVTEIKDPLNNKTTWTHDAAGRTKDVRDAVGNKVAYTYDASSNVTRTDATEIPATGPAEVFAAEYVYDNLNRRTTTKEIDRLSGANILTTTFEFDSRSNLTFRTDAEGNPKRWTYDLASRMTKFERALQIGTAIDDFTQAIAETFAYDSDSRLTQVTDDNFNSTDYEYDTLNRRIKMTYAAHTPPGHTDQVLWTYDKASNVKTKTDQNGSVITNTLDALDRLTSRSISLGTGVQGTTLETFSYDALNRTTAAVDDDYQVEFTYDSVSNLLSEKQGYNSVGSEKWKTVSTGFTNAGSLLSVAYPSGFTAVHTRDAIYRLTAIADSGAGVNVSTHAWQGPGRLATTTNQNGTVADFTYDGFRRVSEIDHLTPTQTFHKFEYAYDKVHNRRMEKNSFNGTWVGTLPAAVQAFLGGRNGKGDVYAYDMAYRMVDARYDVTNPLTEVATPGSQTYVSKVAYTMDGLGNRSQVGTTPWGGGTTNVTYASDVVNQYTTVGGTARTHDGNGNLSDDGTYTYQYDYENHLTQVKSSGAGTSVATYKYGPLGRRVEKSVAGGATTRYILSGPEVVDEYDGADVWQARYIYEDGIDEPRAMDRADIADVDGDANVAEILRFHYHQNALGSVSEMTQPTGAVVEWITYDIYGKAAVRDKNGVLGSASNVGNPYLYTGREWDPESGKYHYRARAYDPDEGRFLQRDPLGYAGGSNLLEYAASSPSTWRDPRGTSPITPELRTLTKQAKSARRLMKMAERALFGPGGSAEQLDAARLAEKAARRALHSATGAKAKAQAELALLLAAQVADMKALIGADLESCSLAWANKLVSRVTELEDLIAAKKAEVERLRRAEKDAEKAVKAASGAVKAAQTLYDSQRKTFEKAAAQLAAAGRAMGARAAELKQASAELVANAFVALGLLNMANGKRDPWEPKPNRHKQGREPGEKKRQGPNWKPRKPPRMPPKHTPSRKD